jgi:iron(III) transport system ATP-binding protein
VFQSYAIWPHMTVFDNVAFPLVHAKRKTGAEEVRKRVTQALERVRLAHLAERAAPLLSGGQQQRVALARALVHEPAMLLLDEPLSNLDAKLRDSMRLELRQLVKSLGITTVLVTHDQVEALGMSDQVALMRDGRIVQKGTPRDIYLEPRSAFAADFMGRSNILPAKIEEAGEITRVSTALGPLLARQIAPLDGAAAVAVIRPQAINVHPVAAGAGGINRFRGKVGVVHFLGDVVEAEIAIGTAQLKLLLDPYTGLSAGDEAIFEIPPERCVVVPADTETPGEGSAA